MTVLAEAIETARRADTLSVTGRVLSCTGMTICAAGLPVPVGSLCEIDFGGGRSALAEVIGFREQATLLMPLCGAEGIAKGQWIRHVTSTQKVAVGPGLLGRVLDGMGRPSDGLPVAALDAHYPLHRAAPDALRRPRIDAPLSVGIRSINAMLTPGCGQRLGVFAGTGVGKSILLGMMARHTSADVAVISLVGERGREVRDFIEKDLGERGLARSVLVVSTSDQSPPLRVRACFVATAIAEYFRDQGANVLLLMDSVTRLAMAARQIGLAAGEPPATKGYPPSVFAMLPRLLERSGRTESGSITGLYTVLVEGDDVNEPVSDAVRGILDGHIVLSRRLANRGQYPAVSVLESVSRVMPDVVDAKQLEAATAVRRLLAVWDEIEDLVNIGAYAAGSNPEYDLAIRMMPAVTAFLRQEMDVGVDFEASKAALMALVEEFERKETPKRPNAEAPKRQK
ncbi:MAG: EscN/YscN/HrcN family type III secretion system ATPase [Phycisphaerae bacterium]|nr:MAG: FliI/YscN family ATPase [Planctomycetia bacterium]RIK66149.1 MAG: EscN/YscN/HrcN family type III secretion system ATPase [Planctomycetota bacterium]GJQ25639.1 MAG: EscN/YscN/HrcN family type III secretion system ATPase [Phycisphaerae bacterium]